MNLNNCQCSLKIIGFVIGWFGVIVRSALAIFFAVLVAQLTSTDPYVIETVMKSGLIYFCTTLIVNLLLLIGISKENDIIIIFFLFISTIEMVLCYSFTVGGIILISEIHETIVFSYFIPAALVVLGISILQWFVLVRLLIRFNQTSETQTENNFQKKSLLNFIKCGFPVSSASVDMSKQ